ncbi:hypothetical protein YC2023_091985 [Brassica napus]
METERVKRKLGRGSVAETTTSTVDEAATEKKISDTLKLWMDLQLLMFMATKMLHQCR